MTEHGQSNWTEQEKSDLDELLSLNLPRSLAEEIVRFRRFGFKPLPKPKGPCLKDKEHDRYPNLPESRVKHVNECLVCKTIIHCLPTLEKMGVDKKTGFFQKLRKFFE